MFNSNKNSFLPRRKIIKKKKIFKSELSHAWCHKRRRRHMRCVPLLFLFFFFSFSFFNYFVVVQFKSANKNVCIHKCMCRKSLRWSRARQSLHLIHHIGMGEQWTCRIIWMNVCNVRHTGIGIGVRNHSMLSNCQPAHEMEYYSVHGRNNEIMKLHENFLLFQFTQQRRRRRCNIWQKYLQQQLWMEEKFNSFKF